MPVEPSAAAELRRRAGELRRLAEHVAATPLREIARRGGPDTWISPQAEELRRQLDTDRRRLDAAADDLRSHARYLERQAEAIEDVDRVAGGRLTCRPCSTTRTGWAPARRRVDAYRHLLTAHSPDPAAASALRVVALVRANLEHGWLPAIDRLIASDAMLSWTTRRSDWARGLTGAALGEALAAHATELLTFGTAEGSAELAATLRRHADDEDAMATFFATLGAAGLLDLIVTAATGDPERIDLPLRLRDAFARRRARPAASPAGYGRELVRAAVAENERAGGMGDGGLALSFLFHGGDLPGRDRRRGHRRGDLPGACVRRRAWAGDPTSAPCCGRATGTNGARACGWTSTSRTAATTSTPWTRRTRCTRCSGNSPGERNGDAGRERVHGRGPGAVPLRRARRPRRRRPGDRHRRGDRRRRARRRRHRTDERARRRVARGVGVRQPVRAGARRRRRGGRAGRDGRGPHRSASTCTASSTPWAPTAP